jgi:hypothetical protein
MATDQKYELMMAVPDSEFMEIARRLLELKHKKSITLVSSTKEHITFQRRGDKIKALRMIDGKPTLFAVEPMSKLVPDEREFIKKQLHDKNPDWNNARLDLEVDIIYEMRASVKKIVEETGMTAEQAFRLLEQGMVESQVAEITGLAGKAVPAASEGSLPEGNN